MKKTVLTVILCISAVLVSVSEIKADAGYTFTCADQTLDVFFDGQRYFCNEQEFSSMEDLKTFLAGEGYARELIDYIAEADFQGAWERQEEYYRTLDPLEYFDIPDEGAYKAGIDDHFYYFIDGEQVSEEYYHHPENWYDTGKQLYGSFIFDGKTYYYTEGRFVTSQEYEDYINDPRNWAEIPEYGSGAYSYQGTDYYYNDGVYISRDEYYDIQFQQEAVKEGCMICSSEAEALAEAEKYVESICWTDDETGLKLAFYSQNTDPLAEIAENNKEEVYKTAGAAYLSAGREWKVLDGRYVILTLKMYCTEKHFESFSKERYDAARAKAQEIADLFAGETDLEKITGVYHYLCENTEYDKTGELGDAYDALVIRKSVCMGYAVSFQMIMENLGIESFICTGNVSEADESHAWNIVRLDSDLYYVDVTFGDTSGRPEQYLLFGTDLREDMFDLGICEGSYPS